MSQLDMFASRERRTAVDRGAVLDVLGVYRYRLWRRWDASLPMLAWVMLNPSTADAGVDDPTIRRCLGFARAWGFGSIEVVNLFAWRATSPKALAAVTDPVGPDNDAHILDVCHRAGRVVGAWGNHGLLRDRNAAVARLIGAEVDIHCLSLTSRSQPGHPLYLAADSPLVLYRPRDGAHGSIAE